VYCIWGYKKRTVSGSAVEVVNPKLQSRRHSSASPFVINEVSKLKGSDSLLEDWRLPCIIFPLPYGALARDP
jgi:hypothetical protein